MFPLPYILYVLFVAVGGSGVTVAGSSRGVCMYVCAMFVVYLSMQTPEQDVFRRCFLPYFLSTVSLRTRSLAF